MEDEWERERRSEELERWGELGQPGLLNMDLDDWDWSAKVSTLWPERHFFEESSICLKLIY